MPRTYTADVPFARTLRAGGVELPDLEGEATIEGTPEEWWIEDMAFACNTTTAGQRISWGWCELGKDDLSVAIYDALVSALTSDTEWFGKATEALIEAKANEPAERGYGRWKAMREDRAAAE